MALDAASRSLFDAVAAAGAPRLHEVPPAAARERYRVRQRGAPSGPEMLDVRDLPVPGDGAPLLARMYRPAEAPAGTLLFFHGGAFVLGGLDEFDAIARHLAARTGWAVVSVDYRLAPEHPFPAALDDAWRALEWVASPGSAFPAPLAVIGESGGANLAAVCALRAARTGIPLAAQVLVTPMVDVDFTRPSYVDPENQLLVDAQGLEWCWRCYLPLEQREHPEAVPLHAEIPTGVAPAIVLLAQYDPLRDEGAEYAARLARAGVPVDCRLFEGQMHGFFPVSALPVFAGALGHIAAQLDAAATRVATGGQSDTAP